METPKLISLNTEELAKYQDKLLKRREYQKQYMAKKRANDPDFVKKANESRNERKKERYKNDEEFRNKEREYGKKYSAEERAKIKIAMEHYKATFGVNV